MCTRGLSSEVTDLRRLLHNMRKGGRHEVVKGFELVAHHAVLTQKCAKNGTIPRFQWAATSGNQTRAGATCGTYSDPGRNIVRAACVARKESMAMRGQLQIEHDTHEQRTYISRVPLKAFFHISPHILRKCLYSSFFKNLIA